MSVAPVGGCSLDHPSSRRFGTTKAPWQDSGCKEKQRRTTKAAEPDTGSASGEGERLRINGYGRAFS